MTLVAAPAPEFSDMFDTIDKMTVLELVAFVKRVEDRFDVVAQPTFVAPVQTAEVAPVEVEEQTEFNVILTEAGQARINVIKAVREITGLGLKEAKDLVDAAPKMVKEGVSKSDADKVAATLAELGATVEVQ